MIIFTAQKDFVAKENTIAGKININDFVLSKNENAKSAWINLGGWQSWNPGFEVEPNKKQPALKNLAIKGWNSWLTFPGTKQKPSKNIVLGQFICYLRWEDFYLVFASVGNLNAEKNLPPVQFIINRNENSVSVEIADKQKNWKIGDEIAKIEVFTAESYFECREKLEKIFGSKNPSSQNYTKRFNQIQFLGKKVLGWESWYNHYEKIDEKLILDDLTSLSQTENLIKNAKKSDEFSIPVFQIDDGYQNALGDWEWNKKLFPSGPEKITEKIAQEGFVPGLWIAPLIVDLRSKFATEHQEWLLRNKDGNLVKAGWNPRWGANGIYYTLDLSIPEVISYLDSLIDKAINVWGFRYLKLDFLYAGMLEGVYKNSSAAYENFSKAIKTLTSRKTNKKGESVTYLGCGNPLELTFNDFPLSRIGCDTYEHWENKLMKFIHWNGRASAYLNMKDTIGRAMWNNIVFANDPDVIFIRNENCSLTYDEKILIATVSILFGSQIMYADDPAKCTSEQELELTKKITKMIEVFKNEEFGIKQIKKDVFSVWSKSGTYKGELSLAKNNHYANVH